MTPVGDIAEVFDCVRQLQHTGVLVRAAHDRSLDEDSKRLWQKLEAATPRFEQEIDLPETATGKARQPKLAGRFWLVQLRTPYRFDNRDFLKVHAVYATAVDCLEGETPVSWMLLTTEVIADVHSGFQLDRTFHSVISVLRPCRFLLLM